MTINDKIKQILIDNNLTPSYFADEIGVQRSSISHILSGRNRPSFDIIQKIIRRFPELGYEWIMEEESQPTNQAAYGNRPVGRPATDRSDRQLPGQLSITTPYVPQPISPPTTIRSQRTEIPPLNISLLAPQLPVDTPSAPAVAQDVPPAAPADKKVERILIFYTDGSFREFAPSTT